MCHSLHGSCQTQPHFHLHMHAHKAVHALARRSMHAFARRSVHALARRSMHALARRSMHALARRSVHALSPHGRHWLQRAAMHEAQPLLPVRVLAQHDEAPAGSVVRQVVGRLTCTCKGAGRRAQHTCTSTERRHMPQQQRRART